MSYSPQSPAGSSPASAAGGNEAETDKIWESRVRSLPRLPTLRPRALTPSMDSASSKGPKALFQETCSWFRLPPNIRSGILRLAFGDGRLHMHLGFSHPDAARQLSPDHHCGIDNVPSSRFRNRRERVIDSSRPKDWQWWSSVCHRLRPDGLPGPMTNGGLDGPWADHCRDGDARNCPVENGSGTPAECHVGVMGWLLSCRQNYAETVDILYSTNTLSMRGESMLTHLPQLLLPQRLEIMTSLEISWPLKTLYVEDELDKADLDEDHLEIILKLLVSSKFPALRRLYLSLEESDQSWFAIHGEEDYIEAILKHLDPFVQRMAHLRECAVAIPDQFFDFVYGDAAFVYVEPGVYGHTLKSFRQIWRGTDGKMTVVQLPYANSYPAPPHHLVKDGSDVPGYWILEGSDRIKPESPSPKSSCCFSMEDDTWGMTVA
ncbi:hypothetical protein FALBO_1886 [Fusarium albosuccineum]|uniref:DUF7730 domain-containing protein n=1 Tax=Fusarium albosuccineum TaxID=1237068 RepID=A0A8H4LNT4_9HYPO|nr:hypothetical protein FALBO_1886 [Fusarium albosuccineum]